MSTATVPYTFANLTNADATQVNANITALLNYLNLEVVVRDATTAFTQVPIGPSANPTLDNHLARKLYVDQVMPAGVVLEYSGATLPPGFVWADGALYDGTNPLYARLWAATGVQHGGTGVSSFAVVDRRGRVGVGKDATSDFSTLGQKAGAKAPAVPLLQHQHDMGHQHAQSTSGAADRSLDHLHTSGTLNGTTSTGGDHWHQPSNAGSFIANGGVVGSGPQGTTGSPNISVNTGAGHVYQGGTGSPSTLHNHTVSMTAGTTGGMDRSIDHLHVVPNTPFAGNTGFQGTAGVTMSVLQPYVALNYIVKL